jgi:hypothetical protein
MAKTAVASDDSGRWKCPDCQGWVLPTVDCHYCHAPVVITIPQPYPVYTPPYQVYPTITPWWQSPVTSTITCGTITTNAAA